MKIQTFEHFCADHLQRATVTIQSFEHFCADHRRLTDCPHCRGTGLAPKTKRRPALPCKRCNSTGHNVIARAIYDRAVSEDLARLAKWNPQQTE